MKPKNIIIHFITLSLFLLFTENVMAQNVIRLSAYGNNYYYINSYSGFPLSENRNHTLQLDFLQAASVTPNWTLKVKVNTPMRSNTPNIAKTDFPLEKIRVKLMSDYIGYGAPTPLPTLDNIHANRNEIPLLNVGSELTLINRASIPLSNRQDGGLQIKYYIGIEVMGGAYLGGMLSDIGNQTSNINPARYELNLTFLLYNENNQLIASAPYIISMQLHRPFSGNPNEYEPEYGLSVLGEAINGNIEFNSINSYRTGARVDFINALKVNSKTGFDVKIKSLSPHLSNDSGNTLPVDIIKIQLENGAQNPQNYIFPEIQLNTSPQTVISSQSGSNQAQYFNIKYHVPAEDRRIINVKSGIYSSILQFQLIPK